MSPTTGFPIKLNKAVKRAEVFWASASADAECEMLKTWVPGCGTIAQHDSAELARLAAQRWEAMCEWGTTASSFTELSAVIHQSPSEEVSAMLLAGTDWFEPDLLGVCLFHRTWTNNIFLDFLAAHPATMDQQSLIRGVGTGLLCALCDVSLKLEASLLWGETTAQSVGYYRDVFGLPDLGDLLAVPPRVQRSFHELTHRKWSAVRPAS